MANKQTELVYTEKEQVAIDALKAADRPLAIKEMGVASGVVVSLCKKAQKFADDPNVVKIAVEDREDVCPTCGHKKAYKVYQIIG